MNEKELIDKVHSAVYHQCQRRGYAAPVDVLMDVGVLTKEKYEDMALFQISNKVQSPYVGFDLPAYQVG